ncbi:MAG: ATP-dependent RNA helicase HrpA [Propionibacteriaceae bacterium]|nr:ATP-dependent RNA helicase HrpA [Micropruina sp.]HBY24083.1 ATP-dependent RNA helicase HrpA [Propionibacteriaceae bacterium]
METLRLTFPEDLPITASVPLIRVALENAQVIVVAGETGSGKTTQLPKICLLAGRKTIAHTQPRRIAARAVAERLAEELAVPLGDVVGYQVRFTRRTSKATRVKVMTDGVLLAEIAHDRDLRAYDTIIIDEAHERSLNIDFLLGYLKQLLPRRPELKVIITSATIDTDRFSEHFGGAPIIEVSGRTYPVEVRYRPVVGDAAERDRDQVRAVCDAVTELATPNDWGDILVFFAGEREIRDAADALSALNLPFTEVLPLYGRLSAAEQHRVFASHTGRRIVLATNVAETSLTVPGIRYVVDPGFARISRYSARTKVQRLPIEPISQASANQRAGRCGRLGPGIAIRLYSEEDYLTRPEFTEPEILRTNLASVILAMAQARLGAISAFPFIEPPDSAHVRDGLRLLSELGAIESAKSDDVRLTKVGHKLARMPLDPRLARMLVEAERLGCLRELLVLASGLTIQDPRERPTEHQAQADLMHRRFWAPVAAEGEESSPDGSDFAAFIRLWDYLRDSRHHLSGNAFRRMCRDEYLNFLRIREWQDLHAQLKEVCQELGMQRNTEAGSLEGVHTAVLSGLLSHVGLLDERVKPVRGKRPGPREYIGARGARFAISPGSSAARQSPPLIVAYELVETSRLWARTVAPVREEWIEEVGGHLLKRNLSEPRWDERGGQAVATQRLTLLGVPLGDRLVSLGKIDPVLARDIFIQSALVEGRWHTRHHFFARNAERRAEAEALGERVRRRDIVVDDRAIFSFYAERIPDSIVSVAHFDRWWREARRTDEHLLDLAMDDLLLGDEGVDPDAYPETWQVGGLDLAVDYTFDPGAGEDGVTVVVPLGKLNQAPPSAFTWQVPGLRVELATELIRTLPKQLRTRFVPAPNYAASAVADLRGDPAAVSFGEALAAALTRASGVAVSAADFRPDALPSHLRVRFDIVQGQKQIATGEDLAELRRTLAPQVSATIAKAAGGTVKPKSTTWTFGTIPRRVDARGGLTGFPGLVDRLDGVSVEVHESQRVADLAHVRGVRRLIALTTPDPVKWTVSHLSNPVKFALASSPYPSVPDLLADCRLKAIDQLMRESVAEVTSVRDQASFQRLADTVRAGAADRMLQVVNQVGAMLTTAGEVRREVAELPAGSSATAADVTEQVDNLLFRGFVAATPDPWWGRLPRYLQAARVRVTAAKSNPSRDLALLDTIMELEAEYGAACARYPDKVLPTEVADVGWLLEEQRVSMFAQTLGTAVPVSPKRIRTALATLPSPTKSALG